MRKKNGLITALLIAVLLFIPSLALPADVGNIDGLWWSPAPGAENFYVMVRERENFVENQDWVLITTLDGTDMSGEAYFGIIEGNSVCVSRLISQLTAFTATATFESASSANFVVTECQPAAECPFPPNLPIPFMKIF